MWDLPGEAVVTLGRGAGAVVAAPPPVADVEGAVVGDTVLGTTGAATAPSPGSWLPPVAPVSFAGVGSKRWVQPSPASHTSGHACASWVVTWNTPSRSWPGVKPTARRVGSLSARAITA